MYVFVFHENDKIVSGFKTDAFCFLCSIILLIQQTVLKQAVHAHAHAQIPASSSAMI